MPNDLFSKYERDSLLMVSVNLMVAGSVSAVVLGHPMAVDP
jgi:hypothetical protein